MSPPSAIRTANFLVEKKFGRTFFGRKTFSTEKKFPPEKKSAEKKKKKKKKKKTNFFRPKIFRPKTFHAAEMFSAENFSSNFFSAETFSAEKFSAEKQSAEIFSCEKFFDRKFRRSYRRRRKQWGVPGGWEPPPGPSVRPFGRFGRSQLYRDVVRVFLDQSLHCLLFVPIWDHLLLDSLNAIDVWIDLYSNVRCRTRHLQTSMDLAWHSTDRCSTSQHWIQMAWAKMVNSVSK